MAVAVDTRRDLYSEAAERLGRDLHRSERVIRLAENDRILEDAKQRLAAAIEEEKRRAIREYLAGRGAGSLRVTAKMAGILLGLRDAGRRAASREVAELLPGREMAARGAVERLTSDSDLAPLRDALNGHLRGISRRVEREAAILDFGVLGAGSVYRSVERRVPGALDAASRLVSTGFGRGLGDVFGAAAGLFDGWLYTAIMDGGTCPRCRALDGTRYESWEAIQSVLPDGGPNPSCRGGGRCRCRAVPIVDDDIGLAPDGLGPTGIEAVRDADAAIQKAINLPGRHRVVELPADDTATARLLRTGDLGVHSDTGLATLQEAVVHETGHLLDARILGTADEWFTQTEAADALFQLMRSSPTMQKILADQFEILVGDAATKAYLLQGREMLARAFSQYVTVVSKDERLLGVLRRLQNDRLLSFQTWPDDEFAAIARALEDVLDDAGLLRARHFTDDVPMPVWDQIGPDGNFVPGWKGRQLLGDKLDTRDLHTVDGVYTAERSELHREIAQKYLDEGVVQAEGERQALFLAGGSGSGKSTVLRAIDPDDLPPGAVKIDPDEIKDMLPEFREMVESGDKYAAFAAHEESSDLAKVILREANRRGYNVVIDGTGNAGTGKFLGKLAAQRDLGYRIRVIHVDIDTDEAVSRAIKRAERSGRWVPEPTIRDIHENVARSHAEWAVSDVVDEWEVWANDDRPPKLIASLRDGVLEIADETRYRRMIEKAYTDQEARDLVQDLYDVVHARRAARVDDALAGLPEWHRTVEEVADREWLTQADAAKRAAMETRSGIHPHLYSEDEHIRGIPSPVHDEQVDAVLRAGQAVDDEIERRMPFTRAQSQREEAEARDRWIRANGEVVGYRERALAAARARRAERDRIEREIVDELMDDDPTLSIFEAGAKAREDARYKAVAKLGGEVNDRDVAEIARLSETATRARQDYDFLRSSIAEHHRRAAMEVLSEIRSMGQTAEDTIRFVSKGRRGAAKVSIDEASAFLPSDWIAMSNPLKPTWRPEGRGWHRGGRSSSEIVISNSRGALIGDVEGLTVALHELGHEMEHAILYLRSLQWAYYHRRSRGPDGTLERTKGLGAGYRKNEITREDEWLHAYMGKDYFGGPNGPVAGSAYEILTMGLEAIFTGAHRIDDEHRRFILGLLASVGRRRFAVGRRAEDEQNARRAARSRDRES